MTHYCLKIMIFIVVRGKFRFPMSVAYENENVEQSADTISDEKNNTIETIANKATILVHKTTSP